MVIVESAQKRTSSAVTEITADLAKKTEGAESESRLLK